MTTRTLFAAGLLAVIASMGCAGMSGKRFYEETGAKGHGLDDVVDCPTCPSASGEHNAIVHATHDDGVIPPHSKFHPVPTRPVFAPKVVPALAIADVHSPASVPTPATAVAVDSDEAPAPPAMIAVATKSGTRSVLKQSEPKLLPEGEATMASVLVARKEAPPVKIEHTEPQPTPSAEASPPVAATPSTKSDGWRPRVAN